MEFHVIIPVRYDSVRLPGKPLIKIAGKPMIQHVYERALESGAESVVIATDDERVKKKAESFGATVCMTSSEHRSGTERIAETIVAVGYEDDDIIVNVQGDEPLIPPVIIRQVADNLSMHDTVKAATLCEPIISCEELLNPDVVKVIMNQRGYALLFSRAPIPWDRVHFPPKTDQQLNGQHYRHIGIYAYRARFLQEYMEWEACPLEELELLEQLRILWNSARIHVAVSKRTAVMGVDTPEDVKRIEEELSKRKR